MRGPSHPVRRRNIKPIRVIRAALRPTSGPRQPVCQNPGVPKRKEPGHTGIAGRVDLEQRGRIHAMCSSPTLVCRKTPPHRKWLRTGHLQQPCSQACGDADRAGGGSSTETEVGRRRSSGCPVGCLCVPWPAARDGPPCGSRAVGWVEECIVVQRLGEVWSVQCCACYL